MRRRLALAALAWLAIVAAGAWSSGCTDVSSDCDLALTCPATPPPMCSGFFAPGPCATCAEGACCKEIADCNEDGFCASCLFGTWSPAPECEAAAVDAHLTALTTCMEMRCASTCDPVDQCNPVTNVGCSGSEVTCDAVFPGVLVCLPPEGTPAKICEACNNFMGPYCDIGLRCFEGSHQCARYCCTDLDCGTGKCVLDPAIVFGDPLFYDDDKVGICVTTDGKGPACDAPMMSASMGTCFTGYP